MTSAGDCVSSVRRLLAHRNVASHARIGELRTFFTSVVRHPRKVGAAAPTSRAVAATVGQVVPTTGAPVVLELGPGTGTLSDGIHQRLPPGARHIGIEVVPDLVEHLRARKPWMDVIHGDAAHLESLIDPALLGRIDVVISSIPWSLLDPNTQVSILRQVTGALAPSGVFTALSYLPTGHIGGLRFRTQLRVNFDEVLTHTTWRNFPPILHYICRRPLNQHRTAS